MPCREGLVFFFGTAIIKSNENIPLYYFCVVKKSTSLKEQLKNFLGLLQWVLKQGYRGVVKPITRKNKMTKFAMMLMLGTLVASVSATTTPEVSSEEEEKTEEKTEEEKKADSEAK